MPYGANGVGETGDGVVVALGEDYPELRQSVRKICGKIPRPPIGVSWRTSRPIRPGLSRNWTEGGFLASLIPEEYGGSGLPLRAAAVILEEINASGCTASQGHAQMYIMGTLLRHMAARSRSAAISRDRFGRVAPAGLRRHRAHDRLRHDKAQNPRCACRQRPLPRHRPEGVDLAGAPFRSDAALGAHDAGRGGQEPHRRALGVSRRSAREPRQGPRDPADRGDDQPQHQRGVLR